MKKRFNVLLLGVSSILLILGYVILFLGAIPYDENQERIAKENKERAEIRKEMYEKID
ncbi:hypothetical protein ABEW00_08020 [Rossellomorea vietnamensis]|uniref:hypothetical protein n=1 Tax=Rossellomorea vietnamensis TaxID=218284 RepID=UPI003D2CA69B